MLIPVDQLKEIIESLPDPKTYKGSEYYFPVGSESGTSETNEFFIHSTYLFFQKDRDQWRLMVSPVKKAD